MCGNEIKLFDVQFSLDKIQNYLLSVPSSSTPAFDGIPPTVLSKAEHTLAPFVHLVFTCIIHKFGLRIGNVLCYPYSQKRTSSGR